MQSFQNMIPKQKTTPSSHSYTQRPSRHRLPFTIAAFFVVCLLAVVGCKPRPGVEKKSQVYKPLDTPLQHTANFLSGLPVPQSSPLYTYTQDPRYPAWKAKVDKEWEEFQTEQISNIKKWRAANVPPINYDFLFYPFSGPDIVNALAFYPEFTTTIMLGLEVPGIVPLPKEIAKQDVFAGLNNLLYSLRTILDLNLFRTLEMAKDIQNTPMNGIIAIMIFFVTKSGFEVTEARPVYITQAGDIKPGNKGYDLFSQGIQLSFRRRVAGAKQRTAYFFRLDAADTRFQQNVAFQNLLKKRGRHVTLIKSASYLLHQPYFSSMRNKILKDSDMIIQDDAGIPVGYFAPGADGSNQWNLAFYGYYRVIKMFGNHYQPDLAAKFQAANPPLLPFSYSYGFSKATSNLMVAVSKKKSKAKEDRNEETNRLWNEIDNL